PEGLKPRSLRALHDPLAHPRERGRVVVGDAGFVFGELHAEPGPERREIEARAFPRMRLGEAAHRAEAGGAVADGNEALEAPALRRIAALIEHGAEAIREALLAAALLDDLGVGEQHEERAAPIDRPDAARLHEPLLLHRRHALPEIPQEA